MNYLRITKENIDKEHICCAMSGKQSVAKKEWLRQRFEDGLVFYRRLAAKAGNHLKSGGFLAMEVGIHQAEIVHKMMEETGEFDSFEIISDLGGIERAVCCRKK